MFFPRCHGCEISQPFFLQNKPICNDCFSRLIPNTKAIINPVEGIETLYPLYYSISTNHSLILKWKKTGSISLQKKLFQMHSELLDLITFSSAEVIIPIPQKTHHLKHSGILPTLEIATYIHRTLKVPLQTHALTLNTELQNKNFKEKKQLLKRTDRFLSQNPFELKNPPLGQRVLLVDDLCTTGHTLSQAAQTIHSLHPEILISALVLGYRPLLFH